MKRNILNKGFAIAAFCIASIGCRAQKDISVKNPPVNDRATASGAVANKPVSLTDSIAAKQLDFKTISVKSKATITIGKKENNVTLAIRIKKGEAIWLAVTGFGGIEGARALITPDSLRLMDKINNVYLKKPFSFIHQYSSNQITFNMLQAIITGNSSPEFLNGTATRATGGYSLSGTLQNLVYHLLLNPDFKVSQAKLVDSDQQLTVDYSGVLWQGAKSLPQTVMIRSVAENSVDINMEYAKPVFDEPVEMPFTVPKRFEVIN